MCSYLLAPHCDDVTLFAFICTLVHPTHLPDPPHHEPISAVDLAESAQMESNFANEHITTPDLAEEIAHPEEECTVSCSLR